MVKVKSVVAQRRKLESLAEIINLSVMPAVVAENSTDRDVGKHTKYRYWSSKYMDNNAPEDVLDFAKSLNSRLEKIVNGVIGSKNGTPIRDKLKKATNKTRLSICRKIAEDSGLNKYFLLHVSLFNQSVREDYSRYIHELKKKNPGFFKGKFTWMQLGRYISQILSRDYNISVKPATIKSYLLDYSDRKNVPIELSIIMHKLLTSRDRNIHAKLFDENIVDPATRIPKQKVIDALADYQAYLKEKNFGDEKIFNKDMWYDYLADETGINPGYISSMHDTNSDGKTADIRLLDIYESIRKKPKSFHDQFFGLRRPKGYRTKEFVHADLIKKEYDKLMDKIKKAYLKSYGSKNLADLISKTFFPEIARLSGKKVSTVKDLCNCGKRERVDKSTLDNIRKVRKLSVKKLHEKYLGAEVPVKEIYKVIDEHEKLVYSAYGRKKFFLAKWKDWLHNEHKKDVRYYTLDFLFSKNSSAKIMPVEIKKALEELIDNINLTNINGVNVDFGREWYSFDELQFMLSRSKEFDRRLIHKKDFVKKIRRLGLIKKTHEKGYTPKEIKRYLNLLDNHLFDFEIIKDFNKFAGRYTAAAVRLEDLLPLMKHWKSEIRYSNGEDTVYVFKKDKLKEFFEVAKEYVSKSYHLVFRKTSSGRYVSEKDKAEALEYVFNGHLERDYGELFNAMLDSNNINNGDYLDDKLTSTAEDVVSNSTINVVNSYLRYLLNMAHHTLETTDTIDPRLKTLLTVENPDYEGELGELYDLTWMEFQSRIRSVLPGARVKRGEKASDVLEKREEAMRNVVDLLSNGSLSGNQKKTALEYLGKVKETFNSVA